MKKILFCLLVVCIMGFAYCIKPPLQTTYPVKITYSVGAPVGSFIDDLYSQGLIKYPFLFKLLLRVTGDDTRIKPNVYVFDHPENVLMLYRSILSNTIADEVKVTIPEGTTNREIQAILKKSFPAMSFDSIKNEKEGYLFPDTYLFSVNATEDDIVTTLKNTFDRKTKNIFANKSAQQIHEIVTMASILEREGRGAEEYQTIAGILYKRIAIGMPLQVDATFLYTLGKGSSDLTIAELQNDNPYNTYTRKGLPIGPINNPGLDTIHAAMNPISSPYLYYLHDRQGNIHYAKTFNEHIRNKNKYLH